jgi:polar amino acid transport system substrate-binding protein
LENLSLSKNELREDESMKFNYKHRLKMIVMIIFLVTTVMIVGAISSANADESIDKIISRGKILVGMSLDEPPIAYLDEKGEPAGYQIEIAKDLANAMKVKLEIVEMPGPSRVPFLQTDKVDLVISCFTKTLERALVVDFSIPYYKTGIVLIVPEGSNIQSVSDLKGKKAGALRGTTGAEALEKMAPEAEVLLFEYGSDLYLAFRQGKVDVIADDLVRAQYYKKTGQEKLDVRMPFLVEEDICIGVKKGNQNLLNWVNLFLYDLHVIGKNAEYYKKYLGAEPPTFVIPWTVK